MKNVKQLMLFMGLLIGSVYSFGQASALNVTNSSTTAIRFEVYVTPDCVTAPVRVGTFYLNPTNSITVPIQYNIATYPNARWVATMYSDIVPTVGGAYGPQNCMGNFLGTLPAGPATVVWNAATPFQLTFT